MTGLNWYSEFSNYFLDNVWIEWKLPLFLFIPIIIDTVLGIYLSKISLTFTRKKFWKLFDKILIYFGIFLLISSLKTYAIDLVEVKVFSGLKVFSFCILSLKELYSIFNHYKDIKHVKNAKKYFIENLNKSNQIRLLKKLDLK